LFDCLVVWAFDLVEEVPHGNFKLQRSLREVALLTFNF